VGGGGGEKKVAGGEVENDGRWWAGGAAARATGRSRRRKARGEEEDDAGPWWALKMHLLTIFRKGYRTPAAAGFFRKRAEHRPVTRNLRFFFSSGHRLPWLAVRDFVICQIHPSHVFV
jgi:hypothetical protein